MNTLSFNDVDADLVGWGSNDLAIHRTQFIPQAFLDYTKAARDTVAPTGDLASVAEVPVAVVESWMRQGFNIYSKEVTARDIVRRLRAEGLDHFLTTTRRV